MVILNDQIEIIAMEFLFSRDLSEQHLIKLAEILSAEFSLAVNAVLFSHPFLNEIWLKNKQEKSRHIIKMLSSSSNGHNFNK